MVRFQGPPSKEMKQEVRIVPAKKYPFKITGSHARDGQNIRFEVKEATEEGRPVYLVEVENLKKDPGAYHDMIFLETDNKVRPELTVRVYGNIYDPAIMGKN